MKKSHILLLMAITLTLIDVPVQTQASAPTNSSEVSIFGRKRKGYKAKRGGLFNTGLFRKKNPCGCPKH
ncbi:MULTISPECIES: hypothetical protein [unclassified Spirosoma]|uniref:hypothetical protein n=1 Tax=unclassified Spirosoma TaxID=2621999 RepID=UPI0009698F29|nr:MULTISPECIES: hypothetical protein [unclassified Spirosoma]MBN8823975.1 hypothetical protein [Spirosoma sp.]OJW70386.1 MAG: hypothetical protein BGO59_24300 [Spirosoma sp. 48-14]